MSDTELTSLYREDSDTASTQIWTVIEICLLSFYSNIILVHTG
jgi:hypothetical protein